MVIGSAQTAVPVCRELAVGRRVLVGLVRVVDKEAKHATVRIAQEDEVVLRSSYDLLPLHSLVLANESFGAAAVQVTIGHVDHFHAVALCQRRGRNAGSVQEIVVRVRRNDQDTASGGAGRRDRPTDEYNDQQQDRAERRRHPKRAPTAHCSPSLTPNYPSGD